MNTSTADGPLLHRVEDAARRLAIGRRTAYRLISSGELRSVRLPSGRLRVPEEALLEFTRTAERRAAGSQGAA